MQNRVHTLLQNKAQTLPQKTHILLQSKPWTWNSTQTLLQNKVQFLLQSKAQALLQQSPNFSAKQSSSFAAKQNPGFAAKQNPNFAAKQSSRFAAEQSPIIIVLLQCHQKINIFQFHITVGGWGRAYLKKHEQWNSLHNLIIAHQVVDCQLQPFHLPVHQYPLQGLWGLGGIRHLGWTSWTRSSPMKSCREVCSAVKHFQNAQVAAKLGICVKNAVKHSRQGSAATAQCAAKHIVHIVLWSTCAEKHSAWKHNVLWSTVLQSTVLQSTVLQSTLHVT